MRSQQVDFGNPSVHHSILSVAAPMLVAQILNLLYNIIDRIYIGKLPGEGTVALAGLGLCFPVITMVTAFANLFGQGGAPLCSIARGQQDTNGAQKIMNNAYFMLILTGIALTILGIAFHKPILYLFGASDTTYPYAAGYMVIYLLGTVFVMTSLGLNPYINSQGFAKIGMKTVTLGAISNIILDPIFIYVLGWGLAGAAWATCIAMSSCMVFGIYWYYVRKDTFVRIPLHGFRFDRHLDADILKVGIPASMEMIVMSVTALVMNRIILLVDPVDGIAIYSTGWRALDMLTIPAMAFGFSLVPICAAAYGAGRMDKFREAFSYCLRLGTALMCILAVFTLVAAPAIVSLFTYSDATSSLAPEMVTFLRIGAVFLPFITVSFASSGMFQSLGMGIRSLISTLTMNLLRIPICAALSGSCILSYLWWGMSVSEIIGAAIIGGWAVITLRHLMRGLPTLPA